MNQRRLVAGALSLVVLAVIGLLYLQALSQGRATRQGWMVTRDLQAGTVLGGGNIKQVHIPTAGDQFVVLTDNPGNRRVAHAMRALRATDDNVTEIAFASGFQDSNHFSYSFHKLTGMSPSRYRQQVRSCRIASS